MCRRVCSELRTLPSVAGLRTLRDTPDVTAFHIRPSAIKLHAESRAQCATTANLTQRCSPARAAHGRRQQAWLAGTSSTLPPAKRYNAGSRLEDVAFDPSTTCKLALAGSVGPSTNVLLLDLGKV